MKLSRFQSCSLFCAALGLAASVHGQNDLSMPDASQAATVKQRVALTDITISYHRPLVNGRKIWGGLVPFGEVWRAGANENTTIEVSDPVSVEGQALPRGIYGLHMIPTPDSCTIIFSKTSTGWGSYSYKKEEDALRVTVKPVALNENHEAMEFVFDDLKPNSVAVTLKWEKLAVPFKISVTDETTLENIRGQLKGRGQFTWQALDEGAQFCLNKKINLEEGLRWANASIANEERFDNLSTKVDILKALNKPDEAKTTWSHAMELANAGQLYSYGRRLQNEKQFAQGLDILKEVAKRYPKDVYGYLAQARVKSAAGDFPGAVEEIKQALANTKSDAQKAALQPLLTKLQARQDINPK